MIGGRSEFSKIPDRFFFKKPGPQTQKAAHFCTAFQSFTGL
jgi:hypothetical protein